MLRLAQLIDRLNDRVGRGVSWLALVMILIGAYNAVARFVDRELGTGLSSNTWLEAGWYAFAALFLFGAGWTLRRDAHVRVDVFYTRMSPRARAWIDLFGSLLLLSPFCLFLLWAVWPAVVESWRIKEASPDPGGLPRWPIRAVVPVAVGLLLLQGAASVLKAVVVLTGKVRNAGDAIPAGDTDTGGNTHD